MGRKFLSENNQKKGALQNGPVLPLNTAHVYKTMVCRGLRATLFVGEIQRGIEK